MDYLAKITKLSTTELRKEIDHLEKLLYYYQMILDSRAYNLKMKIKIIPSHEFLQFAKELRNQKTRTININTGT